MDISEVYKAVAASNIEFLKANKSEIVSFVSPAKNTILHIYIISQPKIEKEKTMLHNMVKEWFKGTAPLPSSPTDTLLRDMLKEWPSLLCKANGKGDTPLHMAARHGHADIVRALIGYAKDVEAGDQSAVWKMLHDTNAAKETALHQAVRYEHYDVAGLLIKEDDQEFLYSANEDGETPLYMAVERGDMLLIELILAKYTSPAYEGPDGRTALHAAALPYFFKEAVEAITRKKGLEFLTTKVDDDGRTPLHYNPGLLLTLGEKSASIMADKDGNTALHVAASEGNYLGVKAFIEHCPECFDLADKEGRNALHLAVKSGKKGIVDLILGNEHLSDLLKQKDNNGNTPLHLLATSQNFWPGVLKDRRFDRMALNNDKLNPYDALSNNKLVTKRQQSFLENDYHNCLGRGRRLLTNSDSTNVKENGGGGQVKGSDEDNLKDERQSQLVVAALIATVTFAAGFTLPGGYIQEKGQDQGYAVLTKNTAFLAFVISDSFGLVFSCAAVFMHLLISMDNYKEKIIVRKLFEKALPLTLLAIAAMVIAFITGTYAVLANSPQLAVSVSVIGGVFFFPCWISCGRGAPKYFLSHIRMGYKRLHIYSETFVNRSWIYFSAISYILVLF